MGDLIEFVYPGTGLSLWAIYDGDGHAVHFGVGGINVIGCLFVSIHLHFYKMLSTELYCLS